MRLALDRHRNDYQTLRIAWKIVLLSVCILSFLFATPVSADGFPVVGVLHAGKSPEALAVDTQTHMLYIAHEYQGALVGFNPLSGQVSWRVSLGNVVTDVQVDSSTHRVFATASGPKNRFFILDGKNGQILFSQNIGAGESSIAIDIQRHRAYILSADKNVIDSYTFLLGWQGTMLQSEHTQLHIGLHAGALGVNSRLGRLYVADQQERLLRVIDESSEKVLESIPLAELPLPPLRVDEETGRIYIVCSTGQELDIIDGNTNKILARVPVYPYPEGIAFHTATGRIYVANEGDKEGDHKSQIVSTTITVIDGQTFEVLGTFSVGKKPDGVEADPGLQRIYIAAEGSDAVIELVDSVNLPIKLDTSTQQFLAAHQTIVFLQQATTITYLAMLLTIVLATLGALSPHWRVRGNPRTRPNDESSRSVLHNPRQ